jgi:4-amino-4-deoxy-L-arabinose transferase-like glycosyltransferase
MSGLVRTDMLLALWILLAGRLIWGHVQSGGIWRTRDRVWFAAIVLAALFTKGPVLLAFLLPGVMVFCLLERRRQGGKAWAGWWAWGIPVALLGMWAAVGCWRDEQFYQSVVVKELLRNTTGGRSGFDGWSLTGRNWTSVMTYSAQLMHRLLPWSLVLVLWPMVDSKGRRRLMGDAGARWTIVWFVSGLVVMSLVPGKRADRVFPLVAPLAIMGAYIVRYRSRSLTVRLTRWRIAQVLATLAVLVWGSYTLFEAIRTPREDSLGLRRFCDRVIAWEQANGQNAMIAGPVLDDDQALPVYMRETTCVDLKSIPAGAGQGAVAVIVREEHLHVAPG